MIKPTSPSWHDLDGVTRWPVVVALGLLLVALLAVAPPAEVCCQ